MACVRIMFILIIFYKETICYNSDSQRIKTYKGPKDSYFGYAVQLYLSDNLKTKRILVGAPKEITSFEDDDANYHTKMTGSVYVCSVGTDCRRISSDALLDKGGNLKGEGQMLGASIAVQNNSAVVCAPRWVHRKSMDSDWLKGRCVELKNSSFGRKINLMGSEHEIIAGQVNKGMAASGFSVIILKNGTKIYGMPGYKAFSGGFVMQTTYNKTIFTPSRAPSPDNLSGYMGYSLTTGNFTGTGKHFIVAGMPRYNDSGAVKIFEHDYLHERVVLRAVLKGIQMGSYYGAAICAVDIDMDGKDDLIVGAPNYYSPQQNTEIGRVYVHKSNYYRSVNFKGDDVIILSGDVDSGSRFGSAITHLGDINHDSIPDIAVGTPYERNGNGAVYIFNIDFDHKAGKLIQKLSVSRSKGFGFYISEGLDMDGNLYPDFAVGAYLSDEVHLFYSRNVIQLNVDFIVSPSKIEQRNSEVNLTLCMNASDVNREAKALTLLIDYMLIIDTGKDTPRLLMSTRQGYQRKYGDQLTIQSQRLDTKCRSYLVMHHETEDMLSPIKLTLRAEISHSTFKGPVPMLAESVFNDYIRYDIKCKDEKRCVTDLALQIQADTDVIIFNKTSIVDIRINITNKAEPASVAVATVTVTGNVYYKRINTVRGKDVQCTQIQTELTTENQITFGTTASNKFTLQCYVSNWLVMGGESVFDLTLDVSQMLNSEHVLSVSAITTSDSEEKGDHHDDNKDVLLIPVKHETSVTIAGTSQPEQMTYTKGTQRGYMFTHEYNIWNNGPSPLLPTRVHFKIPFNKDVITNISYTQSDHKVSNCTFLGTGGGRFVQGGGTESTTMSSKYLNTDASTAETTKSTASLTTPQTTTTASTTEMSTPMRLMPQRKRRSVHLQSETTIKKRVSVTCEASERVCTSVQCELHRMDSQTEVKITFNLNVTVAKLPDISSNEIVSVETEGAVDEPQSTRHIKWNFTVEDTTVTVLYPSTPGKESIPLWIIMASVAGGIVIVVGALALCYLLGFFKRKKKQEVKTWKRQSGYYEHKRSSRLSSTGSRNSSKRGGSQKTSVTEKDL